MWWGEGGLSERLQKHRQKWKRPEVSTGGGGDRTRERKKEEGLRGNEKAEVVT